MLKKIFIFIILIISQFLLWNNVFSAQIPVEKVFTDISKDYKYHKELQALYDRWMIFPDENWKFSPRKLLNRDEFVGISMEVSCKKCISPNTDFSLLKEHSKTKTFYDVSRNNKYFYCIAESDKLWYVKWYDKWYQCEWKEKREEERPFCIDNKITLDEALAVILRNSWIFTIEDNKKILEKIYSWEITSDLADDVSPKNNLWQVYTFYWYIQKALNFELKEVNEKWNEKVYKLLEKINNKIYPNKHISKEEFLRISYIALKSNSCIDDNKKDLAIQIKILNKECIKWKKCENKTFNPNEDTFDLYSNIWWICKKWIENNNYNWTFFNIDNWNEFHRKWKYIDNYKFLNAWKWRILLQIKDNCWNKSEAYSTIFIKEKDIDNKNLWLEIDATPLNWEIGLNVDFEWKVEWWNGNYNYEWDYWDGTTWKWKSSEHKYTQAWTYTVKLKVTDWDWKVWYSIVTIVVTEKDIDNKWLSVQIEADPIIWNKELNVHFDWMISWWDGNYNYEWDFGNGLKWYWKKTSNIFKNPWTYTITLIVVDGNWNRWETTAVIKVLNFDSCEIDADWDWIMDCNDILPQISWNDKNNWAPILNSSCSIDCKCQDWYECTNNDPKTCQSDWVCLPKKISLNNCLQNWYNSFIIWNTVCNSCPCEYSLDFFATLRKCDLVFPAITSIDSRNIFSRWNIFKIQ